MKYLLFSIVLLSLSANAETVQSCRLSNQNTITISRDKKVADTYLYFIQSNNNKREFIFSTEEESRGSDVQAVCAGKKQKAFIVSGEFTSNYMKGLAINENGRIDFAEKIRPSIAYTKPNEMMIIFRTDKKWDSSNIYTVYKLTGNKKQSDESFGTDLRPSQHGYEITFLKN
ncbi:hypothetical protein [Chromobacterium vaccinii]|uniref:hypothetical protein n=1 Tax=Chromobacterium vaccinii TaxID=1108595 RepID=UPI0006180217|nr:hypothetical protein [Chromobacterium vaccinii]